MAEDTKKFDLGRWGSFTVGGLAAALLTAGIAQFTECKGGETPVEPDAGAEVDAGSDVIDAAIPGDDAEVPGEDAGEPASF
jgi:hypothetical protein